MRHPAGAEPAAGRRFRAFVAFGSNLGRRARTIALALEALGRLPATAVVACSRLYESAPVGPGAQGPYLNGVVEIRTGLAPRVLLESLLEIEAGAGRRRDGRRNRARTLDLDLLAYGRLRIREPGLEVPHPRLVERPFVLEPLRELAPAFRLPGIAATVAELADRVRDPGAVRLWDGPAAGAREPGGPLSGRSSPPISPPSPERTEGSR